jgi:hypothetical protein
MNEAKKPILLTQPRSLGEPGNAAVGSLRGRRASFSVKLHHGIALLIIASVLLWGGIIGVLRLLRAQ